MLDRIPSPLCKGRIVSQYSLTCINQSQLPGSFEQGQVIDLEELPITAEELTDTGSLMSHTATLGMDNLITVS